MYSVAGIPGTGANDVLSVQAWVELSVTYKESILNDAY